MYKLLHNVRFYVLVVTMVFSLLIYGGITRIIPEGPLQIIRLTQWYAWMGILYVYLALLIGPLVYVWHGMPWRGQVYRSRRAIGVSAFYFALLHASLAFFGQLDGFAGLGFLPTRFLVAIALSFTALIILAALSATSFDAMIRRLSMPKWKMLHRLVYVAGVFILIHAFLIGTHFQDLTRPLPSTLSLLLFGLLWLQARRVDAYLIRRWPWVETFWPATYLFIVSAIGWAIYIVFFYESSHH